jgi:uncharacterized membrane protein YfcA
MTGLSGMTPADIAVLMAAAAGGGLMNAMAGGGTILTFPTLVFLGMPAILANATSTVALLPGAAASLIGYRDEVMTHKDWLKTLLLPSLLGGSLGSYLLLRTPEKIFANLAPLLVLFATVLFMLQGALASRREHRAAAAAAAAAAAKAMAATPTPGAIGATGAIGAIGENGSEGAPAADNAAPSLSMSSGRWVAAIFFQTLISIYGGYFGAAIGILMLAVLGFLGLTNIFAMNGLKNFFGFCINGVAAGYFILRGAVVWPVALMMMGGAIAGGYGGARLARVIGKEKARAAVVVIGLLVTAILFWQRLHS